MHSEKYGNWNLVMTSKADWMERNNFDGVLYTERQKLSIRPVTKLAGSAMPQADIIGYEFLKDGKAVAAVELINNGRIWLHPSLDNEQKAAVAGASAYLLLAENLEDKLNQMKAGE